MKKILNSKWIFIVNTIPSVVLLLLWSKQFRLVKSMLKPENTKLWLIFGSILIVLTILHFAYALYKTLKKQGVSIWYSGISLFLYIAYLYSYANICEYMGLFYKPPFILSKDIFSYMNFFLMPSLMYSFVTLVIHITKNQKTQKMWINLLASIIIPSLALILLILVEDYQRPLAIDSYFFGYTIQIFIIVCALAFFFFVVQGLFPFARNIIKDWEYSQTMWKILFGIFFPQIGLALNVAFGIFGDFNNKWIFIIALITGITLLLPKLKNKIYRLFLFILKCTTLAYTTYFFLIFIPFIPFGVIGILIVGLGILVLTPSILLIIHSHEILKDFKFLNDFFSKKILFGIATISFLVIPLCITKNYLDDRKALNTALEYIKNLDDTKKQSINTETLQKTIKKIERNKKRLKTNNILYEKRTPILDIYFNWIVLDNLEPSDGILNHVKFIFKLDDESSL